MLTMLVRNRVEDYSKWKEIFDAQAPVAHDAGLRLTGLWRDIEDPNNVFFTFSVSDLEKAQAYVTSPESAEVGRVSGVLDGELYYLEREGQA